MVALTSRLAMAVAALVAAAAIVYFGRDGYVDSNATEITVADALYYATVSLSTTGYGDITPVTDGARLATVLAITPLRLVFLIVLVGTTVELLAERSRAAMRVRLWRVRVREHAVVIGFGTKGQAAARTLLEDGARPDEIVVVDLDPRRLDAASALGMVTVTGDATRTRVLERAGVPRAASVVVATSRDDTAVLVTLTARQFGPHVRIVAAVRETENAHLVRRSGADVVIVSADAAGRLLGVAATHPQAANLVQDLLVPETGLALRERRVDETEVGLTPQDLDELVLGVVRGGTVHAVGPEPPDRLTATDRLIVVRPAEGGEH